MNLLTNIGQILVGGGSGETAFPGIIGWLTDIGSALIGNEVFQIMLAVVIFTLLFGMLVGLAKGIKSRRKKIILFLFLC